MEQGYALGFRNETGFLESQQKKSGNLKIFKEPGRPGENFQLFKWKRLAFAKSEKEIFNEKLSKVQTCMTSLKIIIIIKIIPIIHRVIRDFIFSLQ